MSSSTTARCAPNGKVIDPMNIADSDSARPGRAPRGGPSRRCAPACPRRGSTHGRGRRRCPRVRPRAGRLRPRARVTSRPSHARRIADPRAAPNVTSTCRDRRAPDRCRRGRPRSRRSADRARRRRPSTTSCRDPARAHGTRLRRSPGSGPSDVPSGCRRVTVPNSMAGPAAVDSTYSEMPMPSSRPAPRRSARRRCAARSSCTRPRRAARRAPVRSRRCRTRCRPAS